MFRAFFTGPSRLFAYFGAVLIIASIAAQTQLSVLLNSWYHDFYDILQNALLPAADPKKSTADDFANALYYFTALACGFIFIISATNFFARHYCFAWRRALTFAYLQHYRAGEHGIEGASQRLQEDCFRFARICESLGISTLRAVFTLIAFLPILYEVAAGLEIPVFSSQFGLIYYAAICSIGGLAISWFVGAKLPGIEYQNQRAEAAFRKELVLAEDDSKFGQLPTLSSLFTGLQTNYRRLYLHYGYFDLWINLYEQFASLIPLLICGKNILSGAIELGTMMMITNAFSQVRDGFSVLSNNWTTITELRSVYRRLREFEELIGYAKGR